MIIWRPTFRPSTHGGMLVLHSSSERNFTSYLVPRGASPRYVTLEELCGVLANVKGRNSDALGKKKASETIL